MICWTNVLSQTLDTTPIYYNPNFEYTQEVIDSIIVFHSYTKDNVEVIQKIAEQHSLKGNHAVLLKYARHAYAIPNFDETIYFAQKAIDAFYEYGKENLTYSLLDTQVLYQSLIMKALAHKDSKNYDQAIATYQQALDIPQTSSYRYKSYITSGIATCHARIGNDSLALKYSYEILTDSIFMSQPQAAVATYLEIGQLHLKLNQLNLAKSYLSKALMASASKGYKEEDHYIHNIIGGIFEEWSQPDSALYHYRQAVKSYETHGSGKYRFDDGYYLKSKANVAFFEGRSIDAIRNLKIVIDSMPLMRSHDRVDKKLAMDSYDLLADAYRKNGQLNLAIKTLKDQVNFLEIFTLKEAQSKVEELETRFNVKQKEKSIEELNRTREQQETLLRQQRWISIGLIMLLLLAAAAGYLFFKQRRITSKYQVENLQQRLLRTQMNPHFVYNALNTICSLVESKSEMIIPYVNKLSVLLRMILVNSREEFVSLEDECLALKNYLELESNFSETFNYNLIVSDDITGDEFLIPPMLIQPFVENAIKHGLKNKRNGGSIDVKFSLPSSSGLLQCVIIDNGHGIKTITTNNNKHKLNSSVSTQIVKERLQIFKDKFKVNCRFLTTTRTEGGTLINLYLPYVMDS